MEKITVISEVHGTDKLRMEEKIEFTCPPNLPYTMLNIVGGSTNGIICIGVVDTTLWVGRIFGKNIATYWLWRILKQLAKAKGCNKILAKDSQEGMPFFKAGKFQKNNDNDWEREI